MEEIIKEIKDLVRQDYKEIVLLGQNVNSYQISNSQFLISKQIPKSQISDKSDFVRLLEELNNIPGDFKIKFLTPHPKDMNDELIEAMATLPKISHELHLPVQSGDDEILKKMNRGYTAKQYLDLIKKIRNKIPDIKLSTDIIVGFPGETKEQFENTVELCKKVKFDKAYIAQYSPRPGTAAFKMLDDVSKAEKKHRWQILEDLLNPRTKF